MEDQGSEAIVMTGIDLTVATGTMQGNTEMTGDRGQILGIETTGSTQLRLTGHRKTR